MLRGKEEKGEEGRGATPQIRYRTTQRGTAARYKGGPDEKKYTGLMKLVAA